MDNAISAAFANVNSDSDNIRFYPLKRNLSSLQTYNTVLPLLNQQGKYDGFSFKLISIVKAESLCYE